MKSSELKAMRLQGTLSRDDYWRQIQEHCTALLDFTSVLQEDSGVAVRLTAQGMTVELPDGSRFAWDPSQLRESTTLLVVDGAYESAETALLSALATHTDLFVDVGANMGFFTITLSAVNPSMRTVAVEPMTATRDRLEINLALNQLESRVSIVGSALGEHAGSSEMYLPNTTGSVGSSMRNLHPEEGFSVEGVEVTTLDDVVDAAAKDGDRILVKIDVEGAERLVMAGASRTLARNATFLMELSRKWLKQFNATPNEIIAIFDQQQYSCYAVTQSASGAPELRLVEGIDDDTVEVNFLFLPAGASLPL